MKELKYIAGFISLLLCVSVFAQTETTVEEKIEDLATDIGAEDDDLSPLTERLVYYREHPIDLNRAVEGELEQLGLLSAAQISFLLDHITRNGKLLSIYELQSINGFDTTSIRRLMPYVRAMTLAEEGFYTVQELFRRGRHTLLTRYSRVLEKQAGYRDDASAGSHYQGPPYRLILSYRFNFSKYVSWGLGAEKDPGEEFFKGSQDRGFDLYSAWFCLRNTGRIRTLVIGDYVIGFGQGLAGWSSLAFSKTSDAVGTRKYQAGIRPHTSREENLFLRGAGITFGRRALQTTLFVSIHKVDANVIYRSYSGKVMKVSSIQTSGLHALKNEIDDKHSLEELITGINLHMNRRKLSAGFTIINTVLGAEIVRNTAPYALYRFYGRKLLNTSFGYSWHHRNFNFFGEGAISQPYNGENTITGYAIIHGLSFSPDPRLSVSLVHRHYAPQYQALMANAFSEGYGVSNEQGVYAGFSFRLTSRLNLNAYCDHFFFPWLRYQVSAPSRGREYLAQLEYTPVKKTVASMRWRFEEKMKDVVISDALDVPEKTRQLNARFHISTYINPALRFQCRIEWIRFQDQYGKTANGSLLYQDLNYKKPGERYSIAFRYALFDTKSYNERIYAYENDVPGSFSIPSFYYKGLRYYLLAGYRIGKSTNLNARIARTVYFNRQVISEGSPDEIEGNTKTELKLQLRQQF